jgi:hypothetical protein
MLKILRWDHDDAITHDPWRMCSDVMTVTFDHIGCYCCIYFFGCPDDVITINVHLYLCSNLRMSDRISINFAIGAQPEIVGLPFHFLQSLVV